uniref:Conotoxin n=1 Tax=Conus episcopatus TaxID=88764 RepID=A0A0K2S742_CONEP|nr:Conotoxin Superfamily SF3 [Conus episcopatus]
MLPFLLFTHQWWGVDARPKTKDDIPQASFQDNAKRILQVLESKRNCCRLQVCCG